MLFFYFLQRAGTPLTIVLDITFKKNERPPLLGSSFSPSMRRGLCGILHALPAPRLLIEGLTFTCFYGFKVGIETSVPHRSSRLNNMFLVVNGK